MSKESNPRMDLEVGEWHAGSVIRNIPSDEGAMMMDIVFGFGDAYVTMNGWKNPQDDKSFIVLPVTEGMRFRTYAGGGAFPEISNELFQLVTSFKRHKGQIFKGFDEMKRDFGDSSGYTNPRVEKGGPDDQFVTKVTQLRCDDDSEKNKEMDIEVLKNGNVSVTMRDKQLQQRHRESEAEMVFKTAENGGKNPIVAAVFANIAGIIERTMDRKLRR